MAGCQRCCLLDERSNSCACPKSARRVSRPAPIRRRRTPSPQRRLMPSTREALADVTSTGSVKTSPPPAMASNGQSAEAGQEQTDQAASDTHDEDTQWVKTSLAATLHSGPSVSAPILTYYPAGTELQTTEQQSRLGQNCRSGQLHSRDGSTGYISLPVSAQLKVRRRGSRRSIRNPKSFRHRQPSRHAGWRSDVAT